MFSIDLSLQRQVLKKTSSTLFFSLLFPPLEALTQSSSAQQPGDGYRVMTAGFLEPVWDHFIVSFFSFFFGTRRMMAEGGVRNGKKAFF